MLVHSNHIKCAVLPLYLSKPVVIVSDKLNGLLPSTISYFAVRIITTIVTVIFEVIANNNLLTFIKMIIKFLIYWLWQY